MAPFHKSPLMFSIPVEKPVKQIKAHSIGSNITYNIIKKVLVYSRKSVGPRTLNLEHQH